MSGLTKEQRKLYDKLQDAITSPGNFAGVLQGVSKDDLRKVLITDGTIIRFKSGEKTTGNLFLYATVIQSQEGLKAIFGAMKEKNMSFEEIICADEEVISEEFPNVIEFDGTPLKEEQEMLILSNALKESGNLKKCFIAIISKLKDLSGLEKLSPFIGEDGCKELKAALRETGNYDMLYKIFQVEKDIENEAKVDDDQLVSSTLKEENDDMSQPSTDFDDKSTAKTTNKPIIIGSVCGVIAGLAVSVGCFATGVALPILAIAGIAVAAALGIGLIAGGITYAVSSKLEEINAQEQGQNEVPAYRI
ncbi:MAG: hypothetical protein ACR5K6_01920 [Wolbachia sp.]